MKKPNILNIGTESNRHDYYFSISLILIINHEL